MTSDVTGMGVLNMLEAVRLHAGDDPSAIRFYQASSSEMFGKVQEVPQSREHPAVAPLALRREQGLRPLHDDQLPRVLRHARLLGHPVQPRVAAPRARVRHPQDQPGGRPDPPRPAGLAWRWATSTPDATGASPATTSRRCGGCCSRTRPTTTSSPPVETQSIRDFLDLAFAHVGIDDWSQARHPGPALHAPRRGRPAHRRREQGAGQARLDAHGLLRTSWSR